jgi:peptidoglycan/LPS O-acetylase OafA/YrhL
MKNGKSLFVLALSAGDASYSTYLTHGFVIGPAARLIIYFNIQLTVLAFSCIVILLSTGVGILIFKFFEKPLLLYLNKNFGQIK